MIKCIPDKSGRFCVNCGWKWKFPERGWPRRDCPQSPDLRPAADALNLPFPIPPGMAQHLAAWVANGETPPEELAARDAICTLCDDKRPLGMPASEGDTCNSKAKGCGGSGYRPPLSVMQRLPTFRCPAGKWPGDVEKAEATVRQHQLPASPIP